MRNNICFLFRTLLYIIILTSAHLRRVLDAVFHELLPLAVLHLGEVCLADGQAVHGTQETGIETVAGTNGADNFFGRNLRNNEVVGFRWSADKYMPGTCSADEYGTEGRDMLAVYLLGVACAEENVEVVGTASDYGTEPAVLLYHRQEFLFLVAVRAAEVDVVVYHRAGIVGGLQDVLHLRAQARADGVVGTEQEVVLGSKLRHVIIRGGKRFFFIKGIVCITIYVQIGQGECCTFIVANLKILRGNAITMHEVHNLMPHPVVAGISHELARHTASAHRHHTVECTATWHCGKGDVFALASILFVEENIHYGLSKPYNSCTHI